MYVTIYATKDDYTAYLQGKEAVIDTASLPFFLTKASLYIKKHTFGNVPETIPDEVKYCTCEIAENLFNEASAGKQIKSETVGGYSRTFADNKTDFEKQRLTILKAWLGDTGLLFKGV